MKSRLTAALTAALLVAAAAPARAQTPDYENEFFTDFTHSIPVRQTVAISRTLRVASQSSRIHAMLVVIDSVATYPSMPQNAKDFAARLARDWNVGDVDTHRGLVALFAIEDHKFYVAKTDNLEQQVTDRITAAFNPGTLQALRAGDQARAMTLAAQAIAQTLPARSGASGSSSGSPQPTHTITRTTHEHRVDPSPYTQPYTPPSSYSPSSSSGGAPFGGCLFFIVGSAIFVWVLKAIFSSVSGVSRGYGRSFGNYYGGYGPSYGGSSGGFLSGMATGGLLGYLFGNRGSSGWGSSGWGGSGWGGSGWGSSGSSNSSYTDTTTTETWSSGGGDSSWSSGGDSSSSSSGFDSFGGGNFDGGGSGGSW